MQSDAAIDGAENRMPELAHFADVEAMVATLKPERPVYCVRPSVLRQTARHFIELFPGTVMYAVKSNPEAAVTRPLYDAGIRHFDTASLDEIATIKSAFPDATAYFMHPVKSRTAIREAHGRYEVRHFAIDHPSELDKLCQELKTRDSIIVVRLATPHTDALFDLSDKFGVDPERAVGLMQACSRSGFRVGLAFHIGSQCLDPNAFMSGFDAAREVIATVDTPLACFDVGGGFPVDYAGVEVPRLERYIDVIRVGVESLALPPDCPVMCEPGRALVAHAQSVVVQVQLRKGRDLYINDGRYGSLIAPSIGIHFPVRHVGQRDARGDCDFRVFGPTCDGLDVLPRPIRLPESITEGDWIEFGYSGAYSNALRTDFNGFRPERFVTVDAPFQR